MSKTNGFDNHTKPTPKKKITLREAYEKAGELYKEQEASRKVIREQEVMEFLGVFEDICYEH